MSTTGHKPFLGFTVSMGLLAIFVAFSQVLHKPDNHWPCSKSFPQWSQRSIPWYVTIPPPEIRIGHTEGLHPELSW